MEVDCSYRWGWRGHPDPSALDAEQRCNGSECFTGKMHQRESSPPFWGQKAEVEPCWMLGHLQLGVLDFGSNLLLHPSH